MSQAQDSMTYMVKGVAQLTALGFVHGLHALGKRQVARPAIALVRPASLVLACQVLVHRNGILHPL